MLRLPTLLASAMAVIATSISTTQVKKIATEGLKSEAALTQYAAICYRYTDKGNLRLLLVTSRDTGRWVLPKGWPMKDKRPEAAQELVSVRRDRDGGGIGQGQHARLLRVDEVIDVGAAAGGDSVVAGEGAVGEHPQQVDHRLRERTVVLRVLQVRDVDQRLAERRPMGGPA